MNIVPAEAAWMLLEFAPVFTQPTYPRFLVLLFGGGGGYYYGCGAGWSAPHYGGGIVGLARLAEESRDGDRREDADDQDDHEQLDQGEAALAAERLMDALVVESLVDTREHGV